MALGYTSSRLSTEPLSKMFLTFLHWNKLGILKLTCLRKDSLFCLPGLICVSVLECNTLFELSEKTRGARERERKQVGKLVSMTHTGGQEGRQARYLICSPIVFGVDPKFRSVEQITIVEKVIISKVITTQVIRSSHFK